MSFDDVASETDPNKAGMDWQAVNDLVINAG